MPNVKSQPPAGAREHIRDESCGLIDIIPRAHRDANNHDNVRATTDVDVLREDGRHVHACRHRVQHNTQRDLAGQQS